MDLSISGRATNALTKILILGNYDSRRNFFREEWERNNSEDKMEFLVGKCPSFLWVDETPIDTLPVSGSAAVEAERFIEDIKSAAKRIEKQKNTKNAVLEKIQETIDSFFETRKVFNPKPIEQALSDLEYRSLAMLRARSLGKTELLYRQFEKFLV